MCFALSLDIDLTKATPSAWLITEWPMAESTTFITKRFTLENNASFHPGQ
jgi:hypothetical protein